MAEWNRIVNTTIRNYIRGESDEIKRNRKVMAMLRKRGRILYNQSGDGFDWKVRYRRAPMTVNNGEQTLEFSRVNRWLTAFLDYEGYVVSDSITKRERKKNRGQEAIVKVFSNKMKLLTADIKDQFAEEVYVDSGATGNDGRMSGIETFMGNNGTINITDGTQRSANAADPAGYPNSTYATINCTLGNQGGSWSSGDINKTWPFGRGDAQYDFFSPVIVNYTSSAFSGTDWATNAVEALRFGVDAINTRNVGEGGQVDMVELDRGLYRQYKDNLDSKERIIIEPDLELRSIGFKDVIAQDGVEITSEFGIPEGVGYGWNFGNMRFRSMQEDIFHAEEVDFDPAARSWRCVVDCLGQYQFTSPRMFFALKALA